MLEVTYCLLAGSRTSGHRAFVISVFNCSKLLITLFSPSSNRICEPASAGSAPPERARIVSRRAASRSGGGAHAAVVVRSVRRGMDSIRSHALAMDEDTEQALATGNPAGISDDWTSLILAIDYLLVLDNDEWSKKLAVLTREALYLLEPETGEPDPLMPFGRTWWRIAVKDFADVQYVASERSLRICTSNLFERDAQLAEAPKCSDIRRWHGVIGAVWHELTEPSALKTAFESCLPGDMPSLGPKRPSSPGIGSSWLTQQSRPWRADALPPILALGTLLKERDGLLWGGWTERTFVLMRSGQLLYYLRTPDSNDEVLGDLRGVIELDAAVIEERPLDEEEAAELPEGLGLGLGYPNPNPNPNHNPNPNPQAAELPECSPSFLLITPAEEPEAQPFYEWPKRCATLAVR